MFYNVSIESFAIDPDADLAAFKKAFQQEWPSLEPKIKSIGGVDILYVGRFCASVELRDAQALADLQAVLPAGWGVDEEPQPIFLSMGTDAFNQAVQDFAEGEAKHGQDDPCEGQIVVSPQKPPQP